MAWRPSKTSGDDLGGGEPRFSGHRMTSWRNIGVLGVAMAIAIVAASAAYDLLDGAPEGTPSCGDVDDSHFWIGLLPFAASGVFLLVGVVLLIKRRSVDTVWMLAAGFALGCAATMSFVLVDSYGWDITLCHS